MPRRGEIRCRWCRSTRLIKFGKKHKVGKDGKAENVQRYSCHACGRTTTKPLAPVKRG